MQLATCEACGKSVPLNDTVSVVGHGLCHPCAQALIDERKASGTPLMSNDVSANVDPTVCGWCRAEGTDAHLDQLANVPTCPACDTRMRNYPLPGWVKIGFGMLLVAAIVSFAMNARYLFGFLALTRANRQMNEGQFELAATSMQTAAGHLPEYKNLARDAAVLRGVSFMRADDSASAVPCFQKALTLDPGSPDRGQGQIRLLLLDAEAGVAFDEKKYDQFVEKALAYDRQVPDDAMAKLRVASAYACVAASKNDKAAGEKARAALAEAKRLASATDQNVVEFENRILFRLHTGEIISAIEFNRRFPNGWKNDHATAPPDVEATTP